jgi:hypothetical protein
VEDVREILRGNSRRLHAVERELATVRDRLARLETSAAVAPPVRPPAPAPAPQPEAPGPRAPQAAPARSRPEPSPPRQSMLDWAPRAPEPAQPRPAAPRPAPPPIPPKPRVDLEELLGGRVLALAGALAVLLGAALLVAMAVDRGWIDEPTRIAIGFAGCSALLLAGVALYERRGGTQAALAASGAAIAGLFATLTAGAQLYELFSVEVSLAIAAAIGGAATALALRWNARTFAGLGLLGAMIAPWLVGAEQSGLTIAFVLFVLTIAAGVADLRRWEWLTFSASIVAAAQLIQWLETVPDAGRVVVALSYFGVIHVAAAAGADRSRQGAETSPAAAILLGASLVFIAAAGYFGLDQLGLADAPIAWLGAVAAASAGIGIAGIAARRISRDLAHLPIAIGIGLGDIAFALAVDGVELALGWAASAAFLVVLGRLRRGQGDVGANDAERLSAAAAVQLGLALSHALAYDADPTRLWAEPEGLLEGVLALGAVGLVGLLAAQLLPRTGATRPLGHAVALFVLAYATAFVLEDAVLAVVWAVEAVGVLLLARASRSSLDPVGGFGAASLLGLALAHALTVDADPSQLAGAPDELLAGAIALGAVGAVALAGAQLLPRGPLRAVAHALSLFVLAYASAFVLHGPALAAAWAIEAAVVMALATRGDAGVNPVGWVGAASLLGLAGLHGIAFEAVPDALVYGAGDLTEAAIALGSVAGAAFAMSRLLPGERREERLVFASLGAASLVYLGSVAIVTAFQPDATGFDTATALLDERQQGQLLLSAFWAVTGVGALLVGLARRTRAVRIGGFVLLGIATTKVFLFDLSALEALYRVGSFVALGLLLLGAAFAWQRTVEPRNGGAGA